MNPHLFNWDKFPHTAHYNAGAYALDFDSEPPRAYKQHDFVRLYRGGPAVIQGNPYRDPDQLARVYRDLGLEFRLWSDLGGMKLFSPDWQPIRKGGTDLECVLVDRRYGLIIAPTWGKGEVIFYSPDAWPSGGQEIRYHVPNRERAKRLKAVLRDVLALAHTYFVMNDGKVTIPDRQSAARYVEAFLAGKGPVEITPDTNAAALRGLGALMQDRTIDTQLARWTEDKGESQWLRFKEGE